MSGERHYLTRHAERGPFGLIAKPEFVARVLRESVCILGHFEAQAVQGELLEHERHQVQAEGALVCQLPVEEEEVALRVRAPPHIR